MRNKILWTLKQILPLMYVSRYKDGEGKAKVSVWRQWMGKVIWDTHYNVY